MKLISFGDVANICHEANRAYCDCLGDHSQLPWDVAPGWQRASAINGVALVYGELLRGKLPSAAASHEGWRTEKLADGWKYGPVKDPDKKEHPCMVPFAELPAELQAKDHLFVAIVKSLFFAGVILAKGGESGTISTSGPGSPARAPQTGTRVFERGQSNR